MDVLVIGGTGFLSGAVVSELAAAGHQVTTYTRGHRPTPPGIRAVIGDRKEVDSFVRSLEGCAFDAVIDCICFTPEDAEADIRAFAGRTGHLVMISTDFVYGADRSLPTAEDTGRQSLNAYGKKKALSEDRFFAAWQAARFPVTVLRPPHIMGAGGQLGTGSLQGRDPMLLDRLLNGGPVVLLDGGALLIQPVVHRDIARACIAALGKVATFGRAYNVAGPDCVPTREYYDLVAATIGVTEVEYLSLPSAEYVRADPEKAPFALHRMYSTEKLARDTGYRPETTLRDAIGETVEAIGSREVDGRTVPGKPYVSAEQELRVVEACRRLQDDVRRLLTEQ